MNQDRLQGIWQQIRGRARQQWAALSNDPLAAAAGVRDERRGRVREQRGLAKQRSDRQLEEFLRRNRNWWDLSRR